MTGDTADTGAPAPVDCASLVVSPSGGILTFAANPVHFDMRADGLAWFAGDTVSPQPGIYEGTDPATATLVYASYAKLIVQDPYGNLFWTSPPDVWWVPAGTTVPVVYATGLASAPPILAQDLEVHPSGALVLAETEVSGSAQYVTYISPTGVLTTTETSALPVPLRARAVAWSHDWSVLWVVADSTTGPGLNELFTVDVDALGAPDWTTVTSVGGLAGIFNMAEDLLVDACGGVIVTSTNNYLGRGRADRYDPATGTTVRLTGNVDHGYGTSPMRFGRAPGTETTVGFLSGGWNGPVEWLFWDIGVGAPAWP